MPHIHTEPGQHDHTASVFLFRTDGPEPRVVLHLHKKLGKYMQFGGHVELDETPWQTLVHELREESGYEMDQLHILQPTHRISRLTNAIAHPLPVNYSTHRLIDDHYHTDTAYVATTTLPPINLPEDGESDDIRLFTRQEIQALPPEKIIDNVREIALHIFDHILGSWDEVTPKEFDHN